MTTEEALMTMASERIAELTNALKDIRLGVEMMLQIPEWAGTRYAAEVKRVAEAALGGARG